MCAVRSGRSRDGATLPPLARWVGRPRAGVTANDNHAPAGALDPAAALDPVALLLAAGWRMTLGVCGLGMLAACASLFAVASSHP